MILKNWVTKGPKYDGVHVFEIESKNFSFSSSQGGSGFSFAIVNDLYVPIIEGERVVSAEKWLSGLEGAIGNILPAILSGKDIKYPDETTAVKFAMGLLAFEYRSEHILSRLKESVSADKEVQEFVGLNSKRSVNQVVVENIVNSVDETFRQLLPVQMTIFSPESTEFIITDCPVVDERYVGQRIIVVGPKTAIGLEKGKAPFAYRYNPVKDDLVHSINDALATRSRSWIAGSSQEIVKKYSTVVESEAWLKSKNSEKVHMQPFKALSQGWEFK